MNVRLHRPRLATGVLAWLRLARVFQKVEQAIADAIREHGLSLG